MSTPALSFGAAAHLYDAVRPAYPADAVAWAIGERPRKVLDLGAGTGRLTGVLLAAGHDVVAVDPDQQMLAVLRQRQPAATARIGTAEHIPLADGSVDAVVCGQAYHWFEPATALPEIARVLGPGGVFAPIWNLRDATLPWVAAYSEIVGWEGTGQADADDEFGPWFTGTVHRTFRHSVTMTADRLVDLLKSRSYYLTAGEQRRATVAAAVRELALTHPDLAGKAEFDLPYTTHVYRSKKTSPGM